MGEAVSSSLIVEGRNIIVTEVAERAVAERPGHGTIESIIEWLGLHRLRGLDLPHEYSRRLLSSGELTRFCERSRGIA